MPHVARTLGLLARLTALLLAGGPALAQPVAVPPQHVPLGDVHLQLFSATNRSVVGRGEPFTFEVEAYASPLGLQDAHRVAAAFEAATFDSLPPGMEATPREPVRQRLEPAEEGPPILVLSRRFMLRAFAEGAVEVPPFRVEMGGATFATMPHQIAVYEVSPAFYRAGQSVLPVVAEGVADGSGRIYTRTGTAFLVAPDALVTSLHVVLDAKAVHLTLPSGRRIRLSRAWTIDPVRDVAVLYLNPKWTSAEALEPLRLAPVFGIVEADSRSASEEHIAFTYGWPGGVQRSTAGVHYDGATLEPSEAFWVTSNPVRPGDSGGPLLDAQGRVFGVVTAGSVLSRRRDVLREEVCLATDPRPALGRRLLVRKPRRLKTLLRELKREAQPHVQALRLTLRLTTWPRRVGSASGKASEAALMEALARLDAAIDEEASDTGLLFTRGTIRQRLGGRAEAMQDYRSVLARWGGHFPAAYLLAVHHLHGRAYAEAARLFQHTRQHPPYAVLATYGLAQAEMRRLRYTEAAVHLQAVLHQHPHFAPALYDLARCYLALGEEPWARQLVAKLYATNPAWGARLRQVFRYPVLRPTVPLVLPRAVLPKVEAAPRR